jgi:glycosyltransferase involved in cell wall biosynthesis
MKIKNESKVELSVSIIASNEAENIKRCLASIASLSDEIILVYNDCKDDTVLIAKRYGAKCFEEKWHGHRDQKNISFSKATKPWVFCIDADEEVSPALLSSMKILLKSGSIDNADGYSFNRRSFFLGKWIRHGDWYPDRKVRLVKRTKAVWKGSREHDKLEVNGVVRRLNGDLLHFSYPSMNSLLTKIIYFSDIFLQRQIDAQEKWRLINVIFRPIWRFIRSYFLRLGFLDGFPGFFIAVSTAFSTFFKHSQLFEIKLKNK